METQTATPVPEVDYGTLPDGEALKKSGEEAADWLAGILAMPRLMHVESLLERSRKYLEAGDYVKALEMADAVRWFMGEYMHPLARAVAASGVRPDKVLQESYEDWVTPHNNDYIPPFTPVRSPEDDNLDQWERIAKLPPAKQEAARQKLEAKDHKAWEKFEEECKKAAALAGLSAFGRLCWWPEMLALVRREVARAEAAETRSASQTA